MINKTQREGKEMENPFSNVSTRFLSDSVKDQLSRIAVGESNVIDRPLSDMSNARLRALIFYVASTLEIQVKTKSDKNGNLWVMRLN